MSCYGRIRQLVRAGMIGYDKSRDDLLRLDGAVSKSRDDLLR